MGKFYKEEDKQYIKDNLQKILLYYGLQEPKTPKGNWKCLANRHKTPENSLTIKNNICCCSCGIKGDSLSVISIIEGLDIVKDFTKIIEKGLIILGCDLSKIDRSQNNNKQTKVETNKKQYDIDLTIIISNIYKNMQDWQYKYFYKRGINNKKLFEKYKIIVSNPAKVFHKKLLPDSKRIYMYTNIIPVWEGNQIKNCILRRDDKYSTNGLKVLNLKDIPLKIFNINYLYKAKEGDIIFITEGIFDALSYENIGFKAISLNSISMINKFIDQLEKYVEQLIEKNVKFILSFDNDEKGKEACNLLDTKIRNLGLKTFIFTLKNHKDINEFYMKNRRNFYSSINYTYALIKNK